LVELERHSVEHIPSSTAR